MISNADKYRQMIQQAIKRINLFPHMNKPDKKPTITLQSDIKLPSCHPFRSSHQIQNNIPITHHITHQSSQQQPTLQNEWPHSCIGLILCEHYQNNQIFYVYGIGILIHNNIVLTSAQNVYCRRLNRQYTNIRFIVGVSGHKCSGIYDVMRVHYPKEYIMQQDYNNYNFAVLQLYDDLSESYGYVGWKTTEDRKEVEKYTEYGYINVNQKGSFKLIQIKKYQKSQYDLYCSESVVLFKENDYEYSIVRIHNSAKIEQFINLSEKIRTMINQWTNFTTIDLNFKNLDSQGCKYLSEVNWTQLRYIYLYCNKIESQGCKYLSQTNWTYLTQIILGGNSIRAQGCKYMSQANLIHLTRMNLRQNNIASQGCKYLSQANWIHLRQINLGGNNIDAQGCKYLSQANWTHLTNINLDRNDINEQGCKYLSQTNWKHLLLQALNKIEDIISRILLLELYPTTLFQYINW